MILYVITNLALMLAYAASPVPQTVVPFPDVPKDHWTNQAVMDLKQKGILQGYPARVIYDMSRPAATWKSLLKAMRKGDEDAIQQLMTPECFQPTDENANFVIRPRAMNQKEQLENYTWLEQLFSNLDFAVLAPSDDAALGTKVPAVVGEIGPPLDNRLHSLNLEFIKTSHGWIIQRMWR